MFDRRHALRTIGAATLAAVLPLAASAAAYPDRAIRLIVTFPAGGSSDAAARIVAPQLAEQLGQPVIVENRPGAGGGVGLDAVAKSPADGYTLVLASAGGLTANPTLYPNLGYAPERDFAPITLFGTSPLVLVANPALAANDAAGVARLAKAEPDRLSYGSGGNGTAMHLSGELFKSMTGSKIQHIPYRGSAPAVLAAMSGETQLAIADIASVKQQLTGGKLKAIGVLGPQRSALAPEIPTLAESGVPGYEAVGWFAILAPAGTPAPIVTRLNEAIVAVLQRQETRERFAAAGLEPLTSTPDALRELMRSETQKWAKVIRDSGAKVD